LDAGFLAVFFTTLAAGFAGAFFAFGAGAAGLDFNAFLMAVDASAASFDSVFSRSSAAFWALGPY